VQDGSSAANAGLKPGDIIQSIDDTKVNSSSEFSERIARLSPGDKIRLTYLREGKSKEISVSLTGRDSSEPALSGLKLQEKLGAIFAPLGSAVKQRYGLRSGIVITALQEGGVFEQAGIPRGTVITTVNGYPINTLEDLNKAFQSPKGGQIRIDGFTPDGARFVFNIPLGA
jgi:S1-C subfamily serine protease